jgi:hypothetical protein
VQSEIIASQKRTPQIVAEEFLNAIEHNDLPTARNLASPDCQAYIGSAYMNRHLGQRRRITIVGVETIGTQSTVSYQYQGELTDRALPLQRRRGIWEVDCKAFDLL